MNLKTIKKIDYYLGNLLIVVLKPIVILLSLVLKREHGLELRNNITVIKLLGGGSLVIAFPALLGLRKKYPGLVINLVTTKGVAPFARSLSIFDNIFEIDDTGIFTLLCSALKTYLKTFGCDTIVDLEVYSRLSTVFSVVTCARNRIGYYLEEAFWRRRIHTHLIYFNRFSGTYEFYDKLFKLFSVLPSSADDCKEHLLSYLPKAARSEKYIICIGHACSDLSKERMLTAKQWEMVFVNRLDKNFEAEVIFLGTEKDSPLATVIIDSLSSVYEHIRFVNLCGKTSLGESLSVLSRCDEFWGVDSSLIHYSRLFKIKSVSWWGPSNPATLLREIKGLQEEVYYCKIPCSPCIHITETPPCMGDNICIQNLFNDDKREWIGILT